MEKGCGRKNDHRATAKKQPNASNNTEESYDTSFENGVDSVHMSLSRYQSVASISSETVNLLEVESNRQVDVRSLTGQLDLETENELTQKLVVVRNEPLLRKQRQGSPQQHRLHSKLLRVSTRQAQSFRVPSRCPNTLASLTSCSKTLHTSSKPSRVPKQGQRIAYTHCIITSPSRYTNTALANNKTVPVSLKPSKYQLTSPRPSQKSKIPRRLNCNPAKTYTVPKSNEKTSKGSSNILPILNRMPVTSWDLNKRHTSLESPPAKKSFDLVITPAPPSLSPSRNVSYNSSKTSESAVSQAAKFPSRSVGVRSKQRFIQRPQFLKTTEKASKTTYHMGKTNRGSQMTAARRRKLNRDTNPARLSLSLPDNLKSLTTYRREKTNKQQNVPGDTILNSKTKTKPLKSVKSRRTKTNPYNKGIWQKKPTSILARSKSVASYQKESSQENPSLFVSTKRKQTFITPKPSLSKNGLHRTIKARRVRGSRGVSCKNPISYTSRRAQSLLWGATRSKASFAAQSRPAVGVNSLGIYKAHSVQRSPQNVRETSFLFKFQSKRWLMKPSTDSVEQCVGIPEDGAPDAVNRDSFAAWELTKHEVLQSCRSEDLLIMNNSVTEASPHGLAVLSHCNKWTQNQTPQPDTFLDKDQAATPADQQKQDIIQENQTSASIRQETHLYFISRMHPLLSLSVQSATSTSIVDRKSHSEYTSSTDTSSTSKWSLCSSNYSMISPRKHQHPSSGSNWPVKSWSCVHCLPIQQTQKKLRGCLTRPKTEMEKKREDSFKYSQFSRTHTVKSTPVRVKLQREVCRVPNTPLEFTNPRKNKNKQGKRYLPYTSDISAQRFTRSPYNHGFQSEQSSNRIESQKVIIRKRDNGSLRWKQRKLSSNAVESEVAAVTKEQVPAAGSNSTDSQKPAPLLSLSPASKPSREPTSTLPRVVRKESQKRVTDAKKCVLLTRTTGDSPSCLWKWRLLAVLSILLLVMCHYLAFLVTISSV